jgi:hypothetical protein
VDLPAGQVDQGAVLADTPGLADLDAVHGDVERVRVEGSVRGTDGGEDAAPVGVGAEDRALEEVVARDGPTDLEGVVDRCGPADLDGDVVRRALCVGDELTGQVGAH